jgi:hypothetical protein
MILITFTYISRNGDLIFGPHHVIEPNINELLRLYESYKDLHTILNHECISKYTKIQLTKIIINKKYSIKSQSIYIDDDSNKCFYKNYSLNLGICNKVYLYDEGVEKHINVNKLTI